jgi:hypothetical protein
VTGEQLQLGEALRDEGMTRTTEAAEAADLAVIDQAIRYLNATGAEWSANDLRSLLPEVRQPLIGARVRAAAMRKEMTRVSYTPSTLASTHSHPIAVWRGRP